MCGGVRTHACILSSATLTAPRPGVPRAEHLTPRQTQVLAHLWDVFFTVCAVPADPRAHTAPTDSRRFPPPKPGTVDEPDGFIHGDLLLAGDSRDMRLILRQYGGERLRRLFWHGMVRGDHPDAVMLRYLRARKWDVHAAINSIGSTARYRLEKDVQQLVRDGEEGLSSTVGGRNLVQRGVTFTLGHAKGGQPIIWFQVGAHLASSQTQAELERGIILTQEWLNLCMLPGSPAVVPPTSDDFVSAVERKVVVFNMSGFSLRNMDWWAVFFLCNSVERWYPETLERVYVHNPPWIFRPIWAILRPLLDPNVREKVRLTNSVEEMDLIPADQVPAAYVEDGKLEGWKWTWDPPAVPGENERLRESLGGAAAEARVQAAFDEAARSFEASTRRWIRHLSDGASTQQPEPQLPPSSAPAPGVDSADDADAESESETAEAAARLASVTIDTPQTTNPISIDRSSSAHASTLATTPGPQVDHRASSGSLASRASRVSRTSRASLASHASTHRKRKRKLTSAESLQRARSQRDVAATKLRLAWLELKPFVTGLTILERQGIFRQDGTDSWAPLFEKYCPTPSPQEKDKDLKFKVWGTESSLPAVQRLLQPAPSDESA